MPGVIAIEEATIDPGSVPTIEETIRYLLPGSHVDIKAAVAGHAKKLLDIHDERLRTMDEEGVEFMLFSHTSPGPQGQIDPKIAEGMATRSNDWLSGEVRKNPKRFGALAALSMHDPVQAAKELTRAVKELGMFGGLVNDYQSFGSEGDGRLYYDTKEYDTFWKTVEELDVPIYFHPRYPSPAEMRPEGKYAHRGWLLGAGVQFHLDLSWHIYAVCSSGVFDRFPKVQIIAGHLGENIPFNLHRADHWLNQPSKRASRPCIHDYTYYFRHNVHITTSGNFWTPGLKLCVNVLGPERCLFAIDTPYERTEEGMEWWRSVSFDNDDERSPGEKIKEMIGRGNAIKLFRLPLDP
ncbi:uncharacterized protein Z518_00855 [Rhinocladiella mackenziei CBS 650.93]|uniref:Amidohydrolase-related domain-containing protein n=1 Tax=Rhinocladiella mackenziei CBS 650.93 TaxID=1442369 RepID=A0A0D2IUK9_9EURO|nr:uncharacterized protein Z518_00855 [Rhinocladiella mackenziei CBS 650.93]KIX09774.1 hypothetical protein Z518_00855 [Rhinocladiella mackenziei CBS 650.93]